MLQHGAREDMSISPSSSFLQVIVPSSWTRPPGLILLDSPPSTHPPGLGPTNPLPQPAAHPGPPPPPLQGARAAPGLEVSPQRPHAPRLGQLGAALEDGAPPVSGPPPPPSEKALEPVSHGHHRKEPRLRTHTRKTAPPKKIKERGGDLRQVPLFRKINGLQMN